MPRPKRVKLSSTSDKVNDATACLLLISHSDSVWNKFKPDKQIWLSGKEVSIGRSPEATVTLICTEISRRHVVFRQQNNLSVWTVQDSRSANGVYVNERKLESSEVYSLQDSDIVCLGPPSQTKFQYRFMYIVSPKNPAPQALSTSSSSSDIFNKNVGNQTGTEQFMEIVKINDLHAISEANDPSEVCNPNNVAQEIIIGCDPGNNPIKYSSQASNASCSDQIFPHVTNETGYQNLSPSSEQALDNKNDDASPLREINKTATAPDLQKRLKELEKMLKEKENLQAVLEQNLQQKEKELQELKNQKTNAKDCVNIVCIGDQEHDHPPEPVMEIVIDDDGSDNAEAQAESCKEQKTVPDEIAEHFGKLLDSEMTCSICSELLVQATTLQCSHTFCAYCIAQWKENKKICPICRGKIITETRALVVDNFINRMVENLGPEAKKQREALIKERTHNKTKGLCSNNPICVGTNAAYTSARTSGFGGMNTRASTSSANAIVISSDSDSEFNSSIPYTSVGNSDFGDSDSSIEGDPEAYYGGYGACFNCGRRGHWAQGCPEY